MLIHRCLGIRLLGRFVVDGDDAALGILQQKVDDTGHDHIHGLSIFIEQPRGQGHLDTGNLKPGQIDALVKRLNRPLPISMADFLSGVSFL